MEREKSVSKPIEKNGFPGASILGKVDKFRYMLK